MAMWMLIEFSSSSHFLFVSVYIPAVSAFHTVTFYFILHKTRHTHDFSYCTVVIFSTSYEITCRDVNIAEVWNN